MTTICGRMSFETKVARAKDVKLLREIKIARGRCKKNFVPTENALKITGGESTGLVLRES